MSASVFFEIFLFSTFRVVFCGNPVAENPHQHQISEWNRNFDSQIQLMQRIASRQDQIMVRFDHLDSRFGRFQSLVQIRFDNIENGLTTTKLRMDLWADDLSRIEEQLTRKLKTCETKFDSVVANVDSKLESKLNSMQRDIRRHSEFISSSFNTIVNGHDKLYEKVSYAILDVNSTLSSVKKSLQHQTRRNHSDNSATLVLLQEILMNNTATQPTPPPINNNNNNNNQSNTNYLLLSNKVTNMFDDLLKKSSTIEGTLKDSMAISNATRRDIHEGFRSVISASNQHNLRNSNSRYPVSSATSSEVMSAVIVEALQSVETLSTALGRRLAELSRSMEERFEIVSMTLNGFLDSCLRIQDGESIMEERIAQVLEKILDRVDNSTRTATQIWLNVTSQLLQQSKLSATLEEGGGNVSCAEESAAPPDYEDITETTPSTTTTDTNIESYAREYLSGSDLTEEDKKSLWDSLFPVPE